MNNIQYDYTIVTAWYDVREKENHPLKDQGSNDFFCSMDWYFESAKQLFNKPFPMVIYTEPRFKDFILNARPQAFHSITRFIFKDYEELPYYTYFRKYEENHNSHPIVNLTQEKFTSLYKFIVNQKVNFVKEVIQMNPFSTDKFGWMDMRLHCVYDMPVDETDKVFSLIHPDRVKIMQMAYTHTDEIHGRANFYMGTRGKVAAGFFAGRAAPLMRFCELAQEEFINALNEDLAPTDEMIYSYVIAHNHQLFDPYTGDYGGCLKNLLRIRDYDYLAINFLERSYELGNHYYTWKTADSLRAGYLQKNIDLSAENVYKVWFFNYVANFWLRRMDYCKFILRELHDIAFRRDDVHLHIRGVHDFFISMIRYVDDESIIQLFDKVAPF
jgi:hypothetical protein